MPATALQASIHSVRTAKLAARLLVPCRPAARPPRPHKPRQKQGLGPQREQQARSPPETRCQCRTEAAHAGPAQTPASQGLFKQRLLLRAAFFSLALGALALVSPGVSLASAGSSGAHFSVRGAFDGLLSFVLHLDKHLSNIIAQHGTKTYGIIAAIIFAETGLVLTPFLPGDSLLFAAGAFAALGSLKLTWLLTVIFVSAVIGDAVNYAIGNYAGARAIQSGVINKAHIDKTEEYYRKHGGKTVVLARFIPIVRTFAPFVAGVGSMPYQAFALYNVGGAALWTLSFVLLGYWFGNFPFVKHNFTLVVVAIVAVSVLPVVYEVLSARREEKASGHSGDSLGDIGTATPLP